MKNSIRKQKGKQGISDEKIRLQLQETLLSYGKLKKVLLIPPDITRLNSYSGPITTMLFSMLIDMDAEVYILPALGTHMPMTNRELTKMFPGIPHHRFIKHHWRTNIVKIGEVPSEFVNQVSEGRFDRSIDIEINKHIMDPSYDLIVSIGQVVPHEVVGMANYNKNILVGCGGKSMIDCSHYIGALYGMERIMGRDHSPVHKIFDYAENYFLEDRPIMYCLTVTTTDREDKVHVKSLATGRGRDLFRESIKVSQKYNIEYLQEPLKKIIVYLKPEEFRTTWVGNKAIYRTRMAIADDGELIILAPGVKKFGEDDGNDNLIAKYGYFGTQKTINKVARNEDLQRNLGVAAHLIHGSSDGRYKIYYAPGNMTQKQIESVGFNYLSLKKTIQQYNVNELKDGLNIVKGEEIFYISNPALGLWAWRERFDQENENI